jgi:hypothetical protein
MGRNVLELAIDMSTKNDMHLVVETLIPLHKGNTIVTWDGQQITSKEANENGWKPFEEFYNKEED